jgi:hypothetical protein
MSVPHFEEYGESYPEHVAAEFGGDLAAALTGANALTPDLRAAVRRAAGKARADRLAFVEVLDAERASLRAVGSETDEIRRRMEELDDRPLGERSFEDLLALWRAVREFESRADALAARRCETLAGHRQTFEGHAPSLPAFVYADESFEHPALAALSELARTLATARRRVERWLAATP